VNARAILFLATSIFALPPMRIVRQGVIGNGNTGKEKMALSNLVSVARAEFSKGESLALCGDYAKAAESFEKAAAYYDRLLSVAPWRCHPDASRVARIRASLAREGRY
jgi:hypothetical protein